MENGNLNETLEAILFTMLGFCLGLLGTLIIDGVRNWRRQKEVRKAVISELKDTRILLSATVYEIETKFGEFDRRLIEWNLAIIESYQGPLCSESMRQNTRDMLKKTDDELESVKPYLRASPQAALHIKKVRLSYQATRIADLGIFDESTRQILAAIRGKLGHFNENIDYGRDLFSRTFDELTNENAERIDENLLTCYLAVSERARAIIEHINSIAPLEDVNSKG